MSLVRYRQFVAVTAALLCLIVLTGVTVRLTKAGLGCTEWPECHSGQLLPEEEDLLGKIEYGNRVFSGFIGLFTLGAVILAYRLRHRRPDLQRWAWGLIAGSAAQILLGRAVVVLELDPIAVAGHFLLSIVMLWNVIVLWVKAGGPAQSPSARVSPALINHGRALLAAASAVLVAGTLVTGTGPNSGDSQAERLGFDFTLVARTHSVLAWCLLLTTVWFALRLLRQRPPPLVSPNLEPTTLSRWLIYVVGVQGVIGYWQYLTGVPEILVGFHVAAAVAIWVLALLIYFSLFARVGSSPGNDDLLVDISAGVVEAVETVQ